MKKFKTVYLIFLFFISCTGGDKEKKAETKKQEPHTEEIKQTKKAKQNGWVELNLQGKVRSICSLP